MSSFESVVNDSAQALAPSKARAWLTVTVASLFFFYEFIQMDLFNAISNFLMRDFSITAVQLGTMSTFYFVANVLFLFASGFLLDRFSTRKIILLTLGLCVVATALFPLTTNFYWASFFRFLTGVGGAFCFLSVIRLATRWFPANQMASVTGVIVTIAFLGGIIAQTPLTVLTQMYTWQHVVLLDAAFGGVIWLLIYGVVTDAPNAHCDEVNTTPVNTLGYVASFRQAFLRGQNWLAGLYTCLMNLPVGLLGGLWGMIYLVDVYHLTRLQASWIITSMFVGTIVGCPVIGWASDKMGRRCFPMMLGALLSLILVCFLVFSPHLSYMNLLLLFVLLGFFTSSQVIGYPLVAESSRLEITATSVSVVNITTQFGIMFFQPFFGFLLDKHASLYAVHHTQTAIHQYLAADFHWAVLLFPVGMLLSILLVILIKETWCKPLASET